MFYISVKSLISVLLFTLQYELSLPQQVVFHISKITFTIFYETYLNNLYVCIMKINLSTMASIF